MESTKEILVVKSDNLLNENSEIIGGFGGGIVGGGTLFPLPKLTENFGRIIKFTIKAGTYSLKTFVGDGAVTKDNCLGIYLQDNSGKELQSINSSANNAINRVATFTVSEDVASKTTKLYIFFNHDVAETTYEEDTFNGIMINSGDTGKDYEPYYYEYESTKEVLVRRSNNLFLPFTSNPKFAIGVDCAFSYDPTLFCTIEENGNIHIHGTKSVKDSGHVLYYSFTTPLTLGTGKTYSYKYNNAYGHCSLESTVSGARALVLGNNKRKVTPTIDTPITHLYVDIHLTSKEENIGKEYDFYLNPMVIEGDTAQDYEPYYYEAEANKLITWAVDDTLVSVMDFSNMLYRKFIDNNGNITENWLWATTTNFSPCTGNTVYWYNANMINYYPIGRACRFVFYDENKQFISTADASSGKEDKSVTSPENARYMKASISRFGNNDMSQPFPIKPIVYIK